MPRPSRLDVAALGASFLFAIAPLTRAEDDPPPAAPRSSVQDVVPPRSAADRWNKVKSQYSTQPTSRIEQPARRGTAGGSEASSLPSDILAPERQPVGATNQRPTALSAERLPEWVLPGPAVPKNLEADDSVPKVASALTDESPSANASGLPSPDDTVRPAETEDKRPSTDDALRRGTRRPAGPVPIPSGPSRNPTQVRRIGEIAPLNDLDHDRDIRDYAAEKAREFNVRFGGDQYVNRNFPIVAMQWAAPESYYYPLYFQDPQLERYGHTHPWPLQPVVSSARFVGQFVLMPYQMTITPPWELQSPLGWYRPGDVAPKLHYQFPWNTTAALVEAGMITGLFYLIP